MPEFEVYGPIEVPCQRKLQGKVIVQNISAAFWEKNAEIADRVGCYVFGIRAGKGTTPCYVGKAKVCFHQECFSPHKLNHYNVTLADYLKGSPVMFFVALSGKTGKKYIPRVERFLIKKAKERNPNLRNVKGVREERWRIKGVIRSRAKKPSSAAKRFREMMGL